jgi:hypothetical protein
MRPAGAGKAAPSRSPSPHHSLPSFLTTHCAVRLLHALSPTPFPLSHRFSSEANATGHANQMDSLPIHCQCAASRKATDTWVGKPPPSQASRARAPAHHGVWVHSRLAGWLPVPKRQQQQQQQVPAQPWCGMGARATGRAVVQDPPCKRPTLQSGSHRACFRAQGRQTCPRGRHSRQQQAACWVLRSSRPLPPGLG